MLILNINIFVVVAAYYNLKYDSGRREIISNMKFKFHNFTFYKLLIDFNKQQKKKKKSNFFHDCFTFKFIIISFFFLNFNQKLFFISLYHLSFLFLFRSFILELI